jgi:hypothetical protein
MKRLGVRSREKEEGNAGGETVRSRVDEERE